MKKAEINVKTNGDQMEVNMAGTPNDLGPMIAQLAVRLIKAVVDDIEDKEVAECVKMATLGTMIMSDDLNIDVDELCDSVKRAKARKSEKQEVKDEAVKCLEEIKALLEHLKK